MSQTIECRVEGTRWVAVAANKIIASADRRLGDLISRLIGDRAHHVDGVAERMAAASGAPVEIVTPGDRGGRWLVDPARFSPLKIARLTGKPRKEQVIAHLDRAEFEFGGRTLKMTPHLKKVASAEIAASSSKLLDRDEVSAAEAAWFTAATLHESLARGSRRDEVRRQAASADRYVPRLGRANRSMAYWRQRVAEIAERRAEMLQRGGRWESVLLSAEQSETVRRDGEARIGGLGLVRMIDHRPQRFVRMSEAQIIEQTLPPKPYLVD